MSPSFVAVRVSRRLGAALRVAATIAVAALSTLQTTEASHAATLPPGFQDTVTQSGLVDPTAMRFAPNGQVFVTEKSGLVWVYESIDAPAPVLVADLRVAVHNYWDRGLLGLTIDPGYPDTPFVYVMYTHDAFADGSAPRWGSADEASSTFDNCPDVPGATVDGCVVYGRLSRLTIDAQTMIATEYPLLEGNWCQQYPSHSVGDLMFGSDGYLYVTAGEGASFDFPDGGQEGDPVNPCDDPPDGIGGPNLGPTAEGGALRSQDLMTPFDPVTYDGSLLRLDVSGPLVQAPPDNPLVGNGVAGDDFVIAFGLRNPFRITERPGTDEIWIADVGHESYEELNRVANPLGNVENFGWPCYEGNNTGNEPHPDYISRDLCQLLDGGFTPPGISLVAPYYSYDHDEHVVAGDGCALGDSSITGLAFNTGSRFPAAYDDALFFADSSRQCIWTMFANAAGNPDRNARAVLVSNADGRVVDLQMGPDGSLYYVDFDSGRIRRVTYFSGNEPPTARIDADRTNGPLPLVVHFDGRGSSDPEDAVVSSYAWDLDGDGAYDDSSAAQPTKTFPAIGRFTVGLRVTDSDGAFTTASVAITAGNTPPRARIVAPADGADWAVGQSIAFFGDADDDESGALAPAQLTWGILMHHCSTPQDCHTHPITSLVGTAAGSFLAPNHSYPSYLELRLTATDLGPAPLTDTASVLLPARGVNVTLRSSPPGLQLAAGGSSGIDPFTSTHVVGAHVGISAPSPQALANQTYGFAAWSDGGAQTHTITAPAAPLTLTATFAPLACSTPADCPLDYACDAATSMCKYDPRLICIVAGEAAATFAGAMTADPRYTGGSDDDPLADSLGSELVFADSEVPDLTGSGPDRVTYGISLPKSATWYLWGRFYFPGQPGSNEANSFFVSVDGRAPKRFGNNKNYFRKWHYGGDGAFESGVPVRLSLGSLSAGSHALAVIKREVEAGIDAESDQPRLDVLCLTRDAALVPTDEDVCARIGTCQTVATTTTTTTTTTVPAPASDFVCVAAESGVRRGAMKTGVQYAGGADADALRDSLRGSLLFADSTSNASQAGSGDAAAFDVSLPEAGAWYLWARMYYPGAPGSNDANSFFVSVDGGAAKKLGNNRDFFRKWHFGGDGAGEQGAIAPVSLGVLAAGSHDLEVEKREVLPIPPRVDVICLGRDSARAPTDADACAALGGCAGTTTTTTVPVTTTTLPATTVCMRASAGTRSGAMTMSTQFASGADLDPNANSLSSQLLFANSTSNSLVAAGPDFATYALDVSSAGPWNLWVRFYYPGAPGSNDANSFFASIDGGPLRKLGNNKDQFRRWHYGGDGTLETGTPTALALGTLSAGAHVLRVYKREVTPVPPRIDVLCLTQSAAAPTDAETCAALGGC